MDDAARNQIQEKYQQQLTQARQQSGQHPASGFTIQAPDKCRILVISEVLHQPPSGQPTNIVSRYGRWIESTEQPYQRHLTLTEEWVPLDSGWLPKDGIGMLVIKNTERHTQVQPTPEEAAELQTHVVEVGYRIPPDLHSPLVKNIVRKIWQVRPGESCQLEPCDLDDLFIRCRHGKCKATLLLLPR